MHDWDRLMRNAAKGNGFVGTSRADEDAYFAAFSDEPLPILPRPLPRLRLGALLDVVRRRIVS